MRAKRKLSKQFIAAFLGTFIISILVCASLINSRSELERAQMGQIILDKQNKISEAISRLLYKTQGLSALVIQSGGEIADFDRVAATMVDDPGIANILIAPNGVVSRVYPLEGNEAVLGLDFFAPGAGNKEAIRAKETGELVLGGPFQLVQGGQALVGRIPVYTKKPDKAQERDFWGIVSVTLKYPDILRRVELDQLKNQGFAFEIWRVSPDTNEPQIIANSEYAYNKDTLYIERPIEILNAKWYFRILPIKAWYERGESWLFLFAGFLISLLVAFLVQYNYELKHMKKELEDVVYLDLLTGALNRRGLFYKIRRELCSGGQGYILCYFDLDEFKEINDRFGHTAGDEALIHFAETIRNRLVECQFLARIGGDEFILLAVGQADKKSMFALIESIRTELEKKPLRFRDETVVLSFSSGCVCFPEDGNDIDALISHADNQMYREKLDKKK